MLVKDPRFTVMKTWEIYVAPSIVQRKTIKWIMKANRLINNPIQKLVESFEHALHEYLYMHPTGLNEIEEDSHVLLQIWSSYDLFAFFPFPELIKNYIYYDDQIPEEQQNMDMAYYREVLQRHISANKGRQYISKGPSYSPKVKTLHKNFPDAKFINVVRSPLRVLPSSVSMFSKHWKTYGEPEQDYPELAHQVIEEQAKHWYIYPHQYLKTLPSDQYVIVRYQDLVADPKKTVENIYQCFGIEMTDEYQKILTVESEIAKRYKSNHNYSLTSMGLDEKQLIDAFDEPIHEFHLDEETVS
jgi:hypothetical protein